MWFLIKGSVLGRLKGFFWGMDIPNFFKELGVNG